MRGTSSTVVVVTPNPAIDVTYSVREQATGASHRVLDVHRRAGGKGVNVGRVLSTFGTRVHHVMPLGGPSGTWIRAELSRDGIVFTGIAIEGETRTTVAVVDEASHPTIFLEPGPVLHPAETELLVAATAEVTHAADAVVLSGSLPKNASADLVERLVRCAAAAGCPVVADLSGAALLAAARAGADVVKPNREEATSATDTSTVQDAASALLSRGARSVVISLGAEGIFALDDDGPLRVPAFPIVRGNPTGAGDAATAGLVLGMLGRESRHARLRLAAALGAAAVLSPVAGRLDPHDVHRFLDTPDREAPRT